MYNHRETRIKNILNTSADGSLLTYNQTRIFNFSPETSGAGLRETDVICTINIPLVVSYNVLHIMTHIKFFVGHQMIRRINYKVA